jgi:rhodanese-related sulfurtransferase/transcriptional regulator with XRE-family HTH domain
MVQSIEPREARALIDAGGVEIIDVREPHEWSSGHIAGARNVPLFDLKSGGIGALPQAPLLFVCARGMRSLSAAQAAVAAGRTQVFSLDGGVEAWRQHGFSLERPAAQAMVPGDQSTLQGAFCELPEPVLDTVVGENVRKLRSQRGLSLDGLARVTGLSRALLGQIELGKASMSVSVVWRLARAFDVPFSALLVSSEPPATSVLRASTAKRLVSPDGRFSSRALYTPGPDVDAEFYELVLSPHSREEAQPHQPGTRESLVVAAGRLELLVGNERHELRKGDAILFRADVEHTYINPGAEECWMYLVMTYSRQGPSLAPGAPG